MNGSTVILEKKIKPNNYYIILYGNDLLYVGRVITVKDGIIKFKFMQRLSREKYDWYKKDKIETSIHLKSYVAHLLFREVCSSTS